MLIFKFEKPGMLHGECLRLDGLAQLILDVVGADFDSPFGDSSSRIAIANDILQQG
jgi:hypothetical protein